MINTIAWVLLVLKGLDILLYPLVIGEERKPYSYRGFVGTIIGGVLILLICGRVLGWF